MPTIWSLAYKGWYYILFPLLLAPFWARRRSDVVIALLFAVAICALLARNPPILGGFSLFLLGAVARVAPAPLIRSQRVAWFAALSVVVFSPLLLEHLGNWAKLLSGLAIANAILPSRFATNQPTLPGGAWHAVLAGFSFSLYMTHAPMLHVILTTVTGQREPPLGLQPMGREPLLWGASLFMALVLYGFLFSRVNEMQTDKVRRTLWSALQGPRGRSRVLQGESA